MTQKSRLGKGLGALFPPLPGDSADAERKMGSSSTDAVAQQTSSTMEFVRATHTRSEKTQPKHPIIQRKHLVKPDVSRETLDSGSEPHSSSQSKRTLSKGTASRPEEKTDAQSRQKTGKENRRVNIPTLGELTHPSDVFFGGIQQVSPGKNAPGTQRTSADQDYATKATDGEGSIADSARTAAIPPDEDTAHEEIAMMNHEKMANPPAARQSKLTAVHGGYLAEVKISDVGPNEHQPRSIFDEDELNELADSIRQVGVLQPIVIRERVAGSLQVPEANHSSISKSDVHLKNVAKGNRSIATANAEASSSDTENARPSDVQDSLNNRRYELIMGERRWRASQIAGLQTIPAIVKTTHDDEMLRDALLENLHRVNLNPLEEAAAYQQMIKEFGLTQAALSKAVSKSRPQIANMLRLLNLPGAVQKQVAAGVLSAGHARALLGLSTSEEMDGLAKRIIAEGLSVRSTEEIVAMKTASPSKTAAKVARAKNPWEDSPVRHHLESRFETKVSIRGSEKHGKIEIVFSSPDDMRRIVNLLIPESQEPGDKDPSSSEDGWV